MTSKSTARSFTAWLHAFSAVGHHDFCPWANRYVYWLKQPIGWFAFASLAAGLTGLLVAPQAWVICIVTLIVTALGIAWPWLSMRGLAAELTFERRRCQENESVTIALIVTNRWPIPVWGLIVKRGFFHALAGNEDGEEAAALARIPAWSASRFEFCFCPPERGIYPHETPILTTAFPFGIWQAVRRIEVANKLIVWPRLIGLRSLPLLQGEQLSSVGSLIDGAGHEGDIVAARPYVQGDSPRRVHWVHTARRNTLIVCERQAASSRAVQVVLDQLAFGKSNGDRPFWNWGVRVVASFCREFHKHACDVTVEVGGERLRVTSSAKGLHRLYDRLAECGLATESKIADRPNAVPTRHGDGMTIVITSAARIPYFSQPSSLRRERANLRVVVLESDVSEMCDTCNPRSREVASSDHVWMRLNITQNPGRQVQEQWERLCHDDWTN